MHGEASVGDEMQQEAVYEGADEGHAEDMQPESEAEPAPYSQAPRTPEKQDQAPQSQEKEDDSDDGWGAWSSEGKVAKPPKEPPPAHLLHSSHSGRVESPSTSLPGGVKRQLTPTPKPMAKQRPVVTPPKELPENSQKRARWAVKEEIFEVSEDEEDVSVPPSVKSELMLELSVAKVKYTQKSILSCFRNGWPLEKLYNDLKNGEVSPTDDRRMVLDVVRRYNCGMAEYFSLDNRRLYVLKWYQENCKKEVKLTARIHEWNPLFDKLLNSLRHRQAAGLPDDVIIKKNPGRGFQARNAASW